MTRYFVWAPIVFFALGAVGVRGQESIPTTQTIRPGLWRAVLEVPGGDLPFHIDLVVHDGQPSAHLVNGEERISVDRVRLTVDSLTLVLTTYGARIATVLEDGRLVGSLELLSYGGRVHSLPLIARHGEDFRFFADPGPVEINVEGRWDVTFFDQKNRTAKGVAEFRQSGHRVTGTFLTLTGDYRFLEGQVSGRMLKLSCYDGGHAFLITAVLGADDEFGGDFWEGSWRHERWMANRDPNAELPDTDALTYLKDEFDHLEFTFPDLDGQNVSLSDGRFQDKVVIVTIGGSWCPNCHDEAAFLSGFYRDHKERGLEVIGLMYEHRHDFDLAVHQIQRFRERYHITYTTLLAGRSDYWAAAASLPMLNHVLTYPTTIFVDRTGNVRRIHTGFTGPGTMEHFESYKKEFTEFVDMLLNE